MSKYLSPSALLELPSGLRVHPSRLIQRDGTLMWKDALTQADGYVIQPLEEAHESHIMKTAQRLEELNCWVSQELEPWDCLKPLYWYDPKSLDIHFAEGYACLLHHCSIELNEVYEKLKPHVNDHEELVKYDDWIMFKRC